MAGEERLDPSAVALEDLYLGLRTSDGLAVERLQGERAGQWVAAGWATIRDGRVVLTGEGWLRLDALVAQAALGP